MKKFIASFFHAGNHTTIAVYILERPSRGAPREYVLHSLDPGSDCASCWFSFPKYTLVYSGSYFTLNPFLAYWRPNTSVQVNNTSALHHIHTDMHMYITLILLFILFFTLLPLILAGRLPLTLPVGHSGFSKQRSFKEKKNQSSLAYLCKKIFRREYAICQEYVHYTSDAHCKHA